MPTSTRLKGHSLPSKSWQHRVKYQRHDAGVVATLSRRRFGGVDTQYGAQARRGISFVDNFLRRATEHHTIQGGGQWNVLRGITVEQHCRAAIDISVNRPVGVEHRSEERC